MSQPPSQPPVPGVPDGATPPRSGLAIASFILGLLFFVPPVPLIGLILGIVALSKISSARGAIGGRGLAIAGIVLGAVYVSLLCIIAPIAMLLPAFSRAREGARTAACRSNLKQAGFAIAMYQCDYEESMPPDIETLCVKGYLQIGINESDVASSRTVPDTILSCPAGGEPVDTAEIDGTCSYIYARVKEPKHMTHPGTIPIMWDRKKWHSRLRGVNVLYADLHVEMTPIDVLAQRLEEFADVYEKPPSMPEELPEPE